MLRCYIQVSNLVTWPRAMVAECGRLGLRPVIVDQGSTYPPTCEWLDSLPTDDVLRVGCNAGSNWFWRDGPGRPPTGDAAAGAGSQSRNATESPHGQKNGIGGDLGGNAGNERELGHYLVTDPDLDLSGIPDDLVDRLLAAYRANPDVTKIGCSLELDDIAPDHPERDAIMEWERKYWVHRRDDGTYTANVGHTLALYHADHAAEHATKFWHAVRLPRPYTARHLPWYETDDRFRTDEELRYYLENLEHTPYWSRRTKNRLETETRTETGR
jgi:hypothetical protein